MRSSQAINRTIETLGLAIVYKPDIDAYSFAWKFVVLPLLPSTQIELGFDDIVKEAADSIDILVCYFRVYWIKIHHKIWEFICLLKGDEVIFGQQSLEFNTNL
jgi:hypothetical protein